MAHPFIACVFEMWNDMQFRYEVLKHFMSLRIGVILTYKNSIYNNRKLLASALIVALYNGSLTHILSLYDKVKDFLFYLSSRYADWNFRRDLLKYAIKTRKEKEVLGIQNTYPEILGKLSEMDAENIMQFCSHHPIYYKRCQQQLLAFGTVGYYLSDEAFKTYESQIMNKSENFVFSNGI